MKKVIIFAFCFLLFSISNTSALSCSYPGLSCNTGVGPGGGESDCPIGQQCKTVDLCGDGSCPTNECVSCDVSPTCLAQGVSCNSTDTCCIGLCQGGTCSCVPNGGSCLSNNECCGSLCSSGKCKEIGLDCMTVNSGSCVPSLECSNPKISDGQVDCQANYVCCRDLSLYDTLIFCSTSTNDNKIINTALGCIPSEVNSFVNLFITWSLGIGGAFTFIVIIWGSVIIITNSHDPKKIQAGWEMIIAAISGMIMIVICVLLINYLGDQVLNLGPIGFRQ